ncbi:hypothetical protein GQ54DRAFT_44685 [Martensiomyces pterosporus]|nr:hypothetical protein GQ54DRAFT_44685 [Martensiomyces pterosporus]
MMTISTSAPSPAQRLPVEVLQHALRFAVRDSEDKEPTHIRPALWTCRLWREAALPIYSWCAAIQTAKDKEAHYWAKKSLSIQKARVLGWHRCVRRILITASSHAVASGELQAEIHSNAKGMFRNVAYAKVHIFGNATRAVGPREGGGDFVDRIDAGQVLCALSAEFPNVREVDLEARCVEITAIDSEMESLPPMTGGSAGAAVCGKIVKASICASPAPLLPAGSLLRLKSLTLDPSIPDPDLCVALARRCSAVLEYLHIRFVRMQTCMHIIRDEGGIPVAYPQLKALVLDVLGAYDDDELLLRQSPSGTPFPRLHYLSCKSAYPFANDVLFRGCQATLRTLVLAVDASTASWLFPIYKEDAGPVHPLSLYVQLSTLEIHVITRSYSSSDRNKAFDGRVLTAAFNAPQLDRLRICYPNSRVSEYKDDTAKLSKQKLYLT